MAKDLSEEVDEILDTEWDERDGQKVPEPEDVALADGAVKIKAVCLYADIAASTDLVDRYKPRFAAKIYKSFLHCASRMIRHKGGVITSFDGDRVMGVFLGENMRTNAVNCALHINHAVSQIIRPAVNRHYRKTDYYLEHAVGVDVSDLFVVRSGVRGSNDLVWIGRSANYAAKLCSGRGTKYRSFITENVFSLMSDSVKNSSDGEEMWDELEWEDMGGIKIYGSSWRRKP